MHLFEENNLFSFFLSSLSSVHQSLPGNASSLFIWNLVSGLHMWLSIFTLLFIFKNVSSIHESNFCLT